MATSFKRTYASTLSLPGLLWPLPWPRAVDPRPTRDSHTHRQVWLSLLWGHCSFLLGPGAHKVLSVPSKSLCFPVLWKFCNQIPLTFKVRFPRDSQSLGRIPGWEPDVGPRTFTTVWELLWYYFSPVFPRSRAWFYCNCSSPTISLWPLLCPWMWGICFWWVPVSSCRWLFNS